MLHQGRDDIVIPVESMPFRFDQLRKEHGTFRFTMTVFRQRLSPHLPPDRLLLEWRMGQFQGLARNNRAFGWAVLPPHKKR